LRGANLTDSLLATADFSRADVSLADLRGATGFKSQVTTISLNAILPDGQINGLSLSSDTLVVRDSEIGISVANGFQMGPGAVLEFLVADEEWGSTVGLDGRNASVPRLGGTLRIVFDETVNQSGLVGTTFDLFDWGSALEESNQFDFVDIPAGTKWDLSRLYSSGDVRLTAIPESLGAAWFFFGFVAVAVLRRGNAEKRASPISMGVWY